MSTRTDSGILPEFDSKSGYSDLVLVCPACECPCLHAMDASVVKERPPNCGVDLSIEFYCEWCDVKLVLVIQQHKGPTFLWWDEGAMKERTSYRPRMEEHMKGEGFYDDLPEPEVGVEEE